MASTMRKQGTPEQPGMGRFPGLETLIEGRNLAGRLQGSDVFRHYVTRRMRLVAPSILLFLATSVACTAASIVFVAGAHSSFLVLIALLCAPVVLIGSLFVELYVFFSWLEGRALARAYHRSEQTARGPIRTWLARKLKADLGATPRIPWGFAAVFLFVPLGLLATVSAKFAATVIVLGILLPIAYARLDR
jgi:hypothetical protein